MITMIKLLTVLSLALATFMQHSSASAVNMFKFKGLGANTSFSSVDPSGCIRTDVDVFTAEAIIQSAPGKEAPFSGVTLFVSQYNICTDTQLLAAEGVAELAEPDLQISSKLNSATLNSTVNVQDILTGTTFDVSVTLAWSGLGPLTRERSNFHFQSPGCKIHSRFKGTFRAAEASGSVWDEGTNFTPEPSVGALLVSSNSGDMSIGCN